MSAFSVARSMAMSTLSLLSILSLVAHISAQDIAPSNATLPPPVSGVDLNLLLADGHNKIKQNRFVIVPLTNEAGLGRSAAELQTWHINGGLKLLDSDNAHLVTPNNIAYISCDPVSLGMQPARIVQTATNLSPKAIILFSLTARSCNLTGPFEYHSIYSTTSIADSEFLEMVLTPTNDPLSATIASNTTAVPSQNGNNNDGGPAPTTAVAMSILYSITGIITLLFLVIIITGAMRAHRNPARYGPRRAVDGRTRQSRAKGLARAMLETLPIVKFGDPEPAKPGNASARDIELGATPDNGPKQPKVEAAEGSEERKSEGDKKSAEVAEASSSAAIESGMGAAQAESVKSGEENKQKDGELGCSICTEDFEAGEDVRVLPCDHKFHPACIDPWLLNVSGTCPLCRHDLNPAADPNDENATLPELPISNAGPPATSNTEFRGLYSDPAYRARRRAASILHLHRLRTAPPEERIAALRRLREQSRAEGAPVESEENPESRRRLTDRLRERFHIRSRPHPDPIPHDPISEAGGVTIEGARYPMMRLT